MLRLKFQNRNNTINFGSELELWDFPGGRVVDSALPRQGCSSSPDWGTVMGDKGGPESLVITQRRI